MIDNLICPDCGGKLLLRRTKRKGRLITHCKKCFGWFFPSMTNRTTQLKLHADRVLAAIRVLQVAGETAEHAEG